MPWENNRFAHHVPRPVMREVWERAGGWCELRRLGCQGDVRLEFHHVVGIAEAGCAINDASNIALVCHWCHNLETQAQARRAREQSRARGRRAKTLAWKLQPEPHPGLKRG